MTLSAWLEREPFALALSSGFFGFFAHCGVVAALEERGLRPRQASGSSAGALVAAGLASGLPAQQMRALFESTRREDFWDPKLGFGLLKGDKFRAIMARHFVRTFDQTTLPLEVAALDVFAWKVKFLNEGSLLDAVYASCAVPVMFHPIKIAGRTYVDGGVLNKSGLNPAAKGERALCVYLESERGLGAYERRTGGAFGPRTRVLRLAGLPRVAPNALHHGPAAFEAGYRRAQDALDAHLPDHAPAAEAGLERLS